MSMELEGVCYMSDHILRQLCTRPEFCAKDIAGSVVMSPTITQLQPLIGNKSWIPTSSEGKQHYKFLTDAMSKIIPCCIEESKQKYPDTSLPFEALRFIPYDREMAHGIFESAPIKPDGLGALSHFLPLYFLKYQHMLALASTAAGTSLTLWCSQCTKRNWTSILSSSTVEDLCRRQRYV